MVEESRECKKFIHLLNVPWTGLGLYNGFRGNRWLRNRIKVFKQFVIPSLQAQVSKDFVLWCSWRREERNNIYVMQLMEYLKGIPEFKTVHTFHGVCFWDDKYADAEARSRLLSSLHGSMGELFETIGEAEEVYMTIQPSDDCYHKNTVKAIHEIFKETNLQAVGFRNGYIMDYLTKTVANYDPTTNPPFYTIRFPRKIFVDPLAHAQYTSLKVNTEKYPAGTPCPSHEYIGLCLKYEQIDSRGFLVGTHGENISTIYNHPFRGEDVSAETLENFGLADVPPLQISVSLRKKILRRLPHKVQRKLRYIFGERIWQKFYDFIRN